MANSGIGRKVRPSGGFELAWWFFMRISGLALVFLALGHLTITHLINNVENINYAFVASRWADPQSGWFWRLWDLTMINLAMLHGFNGLRQILWEQITSPSKRVIASTLIWGVATGLIVGGSYAILLFQENRAYIQKWKAERAAAQFAQTARSTH